MAPVEFNWLHLSDLHWNDERLKDFWPKVRDEFYKDLEEVHKMAGHFDVVIFSGDLTQNGTKDEFNGVINKLSDLFAKLVSLDPRNKNVKFLCVPGNHDLVRLDGEEADTLASWHSNDNTRERFFNDPPSRARLFINGRFSNYSYFLKTSALALPFPDNTQYGVIPGDFSAIMGKDGCQFGFIGLNSAFLHLSKAANKYNIAVDVKQIHGVCDGDAPQWCGKNHINILVTHHPTEWLNGADKPTEVHKYFTSDIAPDGRFHAHLYGHIHEGRNSIYSDGGSDFRREFQGVSLFGIRKLEIGRDRIHGYCAGKIIIENGKGQIKWWPRIRNKKTGGSYRIERDQSFTLEEDGGYLKSDIFEIENCADIPTSEPPEPEVTHSAPTPKVLGRDSVIDEVTVLLREPNRRLITLLGPPGIGKTTIAEELQKKLTADFKDGAYFCSFQEIVALDSLIAKINAYNPESQDAKEETLFRWLHDKNCLLILDNFEDPLTDRANVQGFIRRLLERAGGVKLLITSRDMLGLSGIEKVIPVNTLDRTDSEKLLRKLADDLDLADFLNRGDLNNLLDELGDVPLAIVLAAPNLVWEVDNLTKELKNQNLDVLKEYEITIEEASKDQSVAKSFFLSYSKIKDMNERLLFLVCSLFPAGLKKADAQRILPALTPQNFQSLRYKSLILQPDGDTYPMLAPIRTYAYGMFKRMIHENEIDAAIEKRWLDLCVEKSEEYYNTTFGTGKRDIKELIKELPDIFRVIEYLISKSEKDVLFKILINFTDFSPFIGITKEFTSFLEKASQIAGEVGNILAKAICIINIGNIHFSESRNKNAMKCYNDALHLFKQVGATSGQAICIMRIGDIHLIESRNKDAMECYNDALSIFKQAGDILSMANCIQSIGDIYLHESKYKEAMEYYNDALLLFEKKEFPVGKAACICRIGEIHFNESRIEEAMKYYNDALSLYKQVGSILGEANCISSIGFCFIRDNNIDKGIEEVFKAIKLYEKISDKLSLGYAYIRLGRELKVIAGYQAEALDYKNNGQDILDSIERAM
ncbi:MAG: metallophosphoesterase [Nitrospirae bacterium]|nr:metallophosphoesterase [Nitrospirota bacterium]